MKTSNHKSSNIRHSTFGIRHSTFGILLTLIILAGCSGAGQSATDGAASFPPAFERVVDPFSVHGPDGEPYDHPFLGGLDVPRPQWVDIDGDGDLDLFVQETTNAVMFFENTGTPEAPQYTWRSDKFRDLYIGEWYRFADLDGDSDADLLAEQPYSYIRYYRNDGTDTAPDFVLAADTLRDVQGEAIFSDRQNIPNVVDIDANGRPDLFIGRVDGTVMRYEVARTDADGMPRFRFVTDRFENIEIIGQVLGSLHGANTMTFADIDDDGDLDLFWGDFFEPGLLLLENQGSATGPNLRGDPKPFPPADPVRTSGYNAPTPGDFNGDGHIDLLMGVLGGAFNANTTAANNLYLIEQTDAGFDVPTRRFLGQIDVGSESIPALADLDGDGDLDLLVGNKILPNNPQTAQLVVFTNQGTPDAPSLHLTDTLALAPGFHYAPALADLDGDGDLDLLVGTWNQDIAYYRNTGSPEQPQFELVAERFVELTRGSNAAPALVDIDADGDQDLFVGESSGTLNFYRNDGSPSEPIFTLVSDEYLDIDAGRRSAPTVADLDGDGDFDLLIGNDTGDLLFYRNTGTPEAPSFVADSSFTMDLPAYATPTLGDLDGDGDLDLIVGGAAGGLRFYRNGE